MTVHVRAAEASDHPLFARLFPYLGTGDPVLEREAFVRQLLFTTLVAEVGAGNEAPSAVGYAYFQIIQELVYVRHVVTAPEVRRRGVGRALLDAIAARARAAGCSVWCLNVLRDNTAALALYEAHGMRRAHRSRLITVPWAAVDAHAAAPHKGLVARVIAPEDDARVEPATDLVAGQLASHRALGDRVLMMLEEDGGVVGATSFAPSFPGAYPFRVSRPALALVLLRALAPHARPGDAHLGVMTENQPEVADALVSAGGTSKLDLVHMKGPVPPG